MGGEGSEPPVPIRRYEEKDRSQVESFTCCRETDGWKGEPQATIRTSLTEFDPTTGFILIAHEGDDVLGVAVVDLLFLENAAWVSALGVVVERQHEGIGGNLKQAVISSAQNDYGLARVRSMVHRKNEYMLRINKRFQATSQATIRPRGYYRISVDASVVVVELNAEV
jgi:hypothetical protein